MGFWDDVGNGIVTFGENVGHGIEHEAERFYNRWDGIQKTGDKLLNSAEHTTENAGQTVDNLSGLLKGLSGISATNLIAGAVVVIVIMKI